MSETETIRFGTSQQRWFGDQLPVDGQIVYIVDDFKKFVYLAKVVSQFGLSLYSLGFPHFNDQGVLSIPEKVGGLAGPGMVFPRTPGLDVFAHMIVSLHGRVARERDIYKALEEAFIRTSRAGAPQGSDACGHG